MRLEQQLEKLAGLGLRLNDGITIDDLLYSFDRDDYEKRPYDLILFALGIEVEREPWGRFVCSQVWDFDTECIFSTGDYGRIVRRLCELSGDPDYLTDVSDYVDPESGNAWLKYNKNNIERHWDIEVNDDWADLLTLSYIMEDIERDDKRFYFKNNGQSMILFYLNSAAATELNKLSNDALKPLSMQ
jgi:hypothetical protein